MKWNNLFIKFVSLLFFKIKIVVFHDRDTLHLATILAQEM